MTHPLEHVVQTKRGPVTVVGGLAHAAKHGRLAEVIAFVEEDQERHDKAFGWEEMTVVYPFRGFLDALRDKDAALFSELGPLSPADFWRGWKKVYPEDFPLGGQSLPHQSSIVPRPRKPTMTLSEYDARRAAFNAR